MPSRINYIFSILIPLVTVMGMDGEFLNDHLSLEYADYDSTAPLGVWNKRLNQLVSYHLRKKTKPTNQHHWQCRTLDTILDVSKEEKSPNGDLIRVCEGKVRVSKCEGTCTSNQRPSINTINGLIKECICCREGIMQRKEVTLSICFDPDGNRIPDETMVTTINEPKKCSCYQCS